jgi:EpsD family peptidyl-prolyl cis-trans isomerase
MLAKTRRGRLGLPHCTLAVATALILSACNADKKPTTQLAAKVNGDEISVHQVNNALSQIRAVPAEKLEDTRRQVLDKLVYQQLAVQQAIEEKLDRSPEVVMAIDAARRDVLTRAYLGKVAAGVETPSAEEASKYYAAHPELFAERRIFNVQEIGVPPGAVAAESLREAATGKSMDEVASWLKSNNVPFAAKAERRSAEQIRPDVLAVLNSLKDGQTAVVESPQGVALIRVAGSAAAPLEEAASLQAIQQFLASQQAREVIAQDMERLKGKAKIEYLNDFAAPLPAPSAPGVPNDIVAKPPSGDSQAVSANLEKGVAALK